MKHSNLTLLNTLVAIMSELDPFPTSFHKFITPAASFLLMYGRPFSVGDLVWLLSPEVPRQQSKKLHHPWSDPHQVLMKYWATRLGEVADRKEANPLQSSQVLWPSNQASHPPSLSVQAHLIMLLVLEPLDNTDGTYPSVSPVAPQCLLLHLQPHSSEDWQESGKQEVLTFKKSYLGHKRKRVYKRSQKDQWQI